LFNRITPDLIELSLDFIRNLDLKKLEAIENFLEGNEILTIRSREEGGSLEISDSRRIELVRDTISHSKPSFIGIEISTLTKYSDLTHEIERSRIKLVASYHDIPGSKDAAYLRKILLSAPLQSKGLFATKIVSEAKTLHDNLKVLSLYSTFIPRSSINTSKLVAFCTGRQGRAQADLLHAHNDPVQRMASCELLLPFPSTGILRLQERDNGDDPSDDKILRQLPDTDTDTEAGGIASQCVGQPKVSFIDRLLIRA
jgi:3-dehydroquinate dehydratase type I